jgi:NDP-sugar pyrophosphorylase family protein
MKKALRELKKKIVDIKKPKKISDQKWNEFVNKSTIVLMAGGESSRFSEVSDIKSINKNAFVLPTGQSMIELTVSMYKKDGFKNFVALVYHNADSIEKILGDGSSLGVNIKYSYDPLKSVGKGGAIKNALLNGSIREDHYIIIHNPDDVILDFKGSFPRHIVSGHLYSTTSEKVATVVVVKETAYSYTGMKIINNDVKEVQMYPLIPIPTHIGVTIFSPKAFKYFHKHFDLENKLDFESTLLPILAKKNQLNAVSIPKECWIAVNNAKGYKELLKRI